MEGRRGEPFEWVGLSRLLSGACPDVGELTSEARDWDSIVESSSSAIPSRTATYSQRVVH